MSRPGRYEGPDRLYTLTGGRSRADTQVFDMMTLVVAECDPVPGMPSEHATILRICRSPTAVVELASHLGLPVSIVRILLGDLLTAGRITVRQPRRNTHGTGPTPDTDVLRQLLVGLRNL